MPDTKQAKEHNWEQHTEEVIKLIFKSRFKRGLLAGLIAGAVMDTLDYAAHSKTRRPGLLSIEWFWLMLVRQRPVSRSDRFLAQIGHLVFTSLLGGFFTAVVPEAEERKPILKSCALASGAWFFTQALVRAVKLPILSQLEWDVRIEHYNLSLIYGLVLGSTLSFLKRNINFI